MFSEKLKALRIQYHLTQQELANRIFVSRSAVTKWEQGRGHPSDASLDELSKFFNISRAELFTNEDVGQIVDNLEHDVKKHKKLSFVLIVIIILVLTLSGYFIVKEKQNKNFVKDNQFFSAQFLKDFSLVGLQPIPHQGETKLAGQGKDYAYFLAEEKIPKEVFQNYVIYLFNFLNNSPHITYVGFMAQQPTEDSEKFGKEYLVHSEDLSDYSVLGYDDWFSFYYIDKLDINRSPKSPISVKAIHIDIKTDSYWTNGDFKSNFGMLIREHSSDTSFDSYFLFDEFFAVEKIAINNSNYLEYFSIKEKRNRDSCLYSISVTNYFFHSNIKFTFQATLDQETLTKTTTYESYNYGDYVIFYWIQDSGNYYPPDFQLNHIEVSEGYIWIAKKL